MKRDLVNSLTNGVLTKLPMKRGNHLCPPMLRAHDRVGGGKLANGFEAGVLEIETNKIT